MDFLEKMENEVNCPETIYQYFVISKNKQSVYLFFEGKDDYNYYSSKIAPYVNSYTCVVYQCESKNNVLTVHDMILNQSADSIEYKQLYFVDSDYDDNSNISNDIYVTAAYSIENYYFTDKALRSMLIGVAGLSLQKEQDMFDLENVLNHIKNKRDEIIEQIIFTNAWYSLQIKRKKDKEYCPKLGNIKEYKNIINIKEIEELEKLVSNSIKVTKLELDTEIARLREDPVYRIRGKYLVQSMQPFLNEVFSDAGKKKDRTYFKVKRNISLNLQNIIIELSSYAETPEELTKYIKKRLDID